LQSLWISRVASMGDNVDTGRVQSKYGE
jgi:hypothetical protein